mgnify:CR=1 FL=1
MKNLMSFEEFVEELDRAGTESNQLAENYRMRKLADIEVSSGSDKYCILISVGTVEGKSLITEAEKY